jgi:hypothetical protein
MPEAYCYVGKSTLCNLSQHCNCITFKCLKCSETVAVCCPRPYNQHTCPINAHYPAFMNLVCHHLIALFVCTLSLFAMAVMFVHSSSINVCCLFLRWIKQDMVTAQGDYCSLLSLVGLTPYLTVKNIETSKELAATFSKHVVSESLWTKLYWIMTR